MPKSKPKSDSNSDFNSIREFPLDDQMREHDFKRVYADLSTKQLHVENGKASVISNYTGELATTLERLKHKLMETPEFEQRVVEIILRFVSDSWRKQSEAELVDTLNEGLEGESPEGSQKEETDQNHFIL